MSVKMRSIGTYVYHGKLVRPGDIIVGTTSEYEWLRSADCAIKIASIEEAVETQMMDTTKKTERRGRYGHNKL